MARGGNIRLVCSLQASTQSISGRILANEESTSVGPYHVSNDSECGRAALLSLSSTFHKLGTVDWNGMAKLPCCSKPPSIGIRVSRF